MRAVLPCPGSDFSAVKRQKIIMLELGIQSGTECIYEQKGSFEQSISIINLSPYQCSVHVYYKLNLSIHVMASTAIWLAGLDHLYADHASIDDQTPNPVFSSSSYLNSIKTKTSEDFPIRFTEVSLWCTLLGK
jgi:hypothetical protein